MAEQTLFLTFMLAYPRLILPVLLYSTQHLREHKPQRTASVRTETVP